MLDQQGDSFEDVVLRLVDRLIQRMDDGLILDHCFRWGLQVSQTKSYKAIFLDSCQLGNNSHD